MGRGRGSEVGVVIEDSQVLSSSLSGGQVVIKPGGNGVGSCRVIRPQGG